jgi:hypothetical protein
MYNGYINYITICIVIYVYVYVYLKYIQEYDYSMLLIILPLVHLLTQNMCVYLHKRKHIVTCYV